ncbi:hypothetical protein GOP47_0024627 [Adiantum capillus-veneris]|uniref:Uncharacterized protein n=1 Tax=Adiantum capillus-veneris TaxID=13818 RepID=A0A9D4U307_ADICA|nr:hypothetical protein GOP47_0024627 [Adiantum capillus-veneris]
MDRRNWPWRKKSISSTGFIMSANPALDNQTPSIGSVSNSSRTSSSVESSVDKLALPTRPAEKKRHLSLLENAKAFEALAWKEQEEQTAKELAQKLDDAEKDLISKEAMVKQHAKVAEEAVSGWEKAEAEALSLKQELTTSTQQITLLEGRVMELEEALKFSTTQIAELEEARKTSMKHLRLTQEVQQQRINEAIDGKMQEWSNVKAEMEEIEQDLRQRMLAAEARSCAMSKSLEERAKAITEWQEGKAKAEMEAGLLQVKLESQATEMAAVTYELRVLTKELEIRNQENDYSRKAVDAAHKQHLEDVKKITKLDAECQRLRNLVRRRLPGPAAIAQMKMEADKSEQTKRRRSLGSSGAVSLNENASSCQDLSEKLRSMEEETNILRETLAKRNAELHSARKLCARTANKLSIAEEQFESMQGTPRSVKSTQNSPLDSFLLRLSATDSHERFDDEVSCAESWASALITELAQFKKPKQDPDSCALDASSEQFLETPKKSLKDGCNELSTTHGSPSPQDYSTLRALAGKDAQLQSANLMCKNAMAKLASAEAKLGGTWMSENPRFNVEESVNSVGEAHGIMSKLDRILDDIRIAAASVGDTTDDDNSDNGLPLLSTPSAKGTVVAPASDFDCMKEEVEKQARTIGELELQVSVLEAAKVDLQAQLQAKKDELKQVRYELEATHTQVEELKALELNSKSQQEKLLAEEEAKRGEMQAQLEAKQSETSKLHNRIASLEVELAEEQKRHEATATKREELDKKLQSYVDREHNMASGCRFEEEFEVRARKEREMAAAKEKLAECQRTILELGKQLTTFTSPSSASFDSSMTLKYGSLDTNHYQEVDHAQVCTRICQQRPLAYNSVNPHDDGMNCPSSYSNTHTSDPANRSLAYISIKQHREVTNCSSKYSNTHPSDSAKKPPHANGGHFSKPRRIHSDLSYRTGSTNPVPGMTYSVAEHLLMDDGVSSFYDSRTESAMSSPSSQYTSPNDTIRMQRSGYEGPMGSGVRISLAKSLESAAAVSTAVDGKSGDGSGNGHAGMGKKVMVRVAAAGTTKTGSHGGSGSGKGSKSLSRFFGRSKK